MITTILFGLLALSHAALAFRIEPKIKNGTIGEPHQFPYYVYFQTNEVEGKDRAFCGAALLSDRWIVTAGHCLVDKDDIMVYLGMDPEGTYVERLLVDKSKQFIHPKYEDEKLENDIGLIELPVQLSPHPFVQPIKLPSKCDAIVGDDRLTTMGKGSSALERAESDNRLRYQHMLTYSPDECYDKIKNKRAHFDQNSVICTHSVQPEQYLLTGDSGGPLVRNVDNTLLGVTSYANYLIIMLKIRPNHVFSSVVYHLDWISQQTGLEIPEC